MRLRKVRLIMAASSWFWGVFFCVIVLAFAGRILRKTDAEKFSRLRSLLSTVNLYVGWMLAAIFLFSIIYLFIVGFPE